MTVTSAHDATAPLRAVLQQLIETQIELGILVYDYQATREAKEAMEDRVNMLVSQLNQLNQTAHQMDMTVPLDVVEYIENGRNSDVYTREFSELILKQNQYVNGKIAAMTQFGEILGQELLTAYPELESHVKLING